MELKATYYDVLKKRHPTMLDYIERDIERIHQEKIIGPFGSIDEYSKYFDAYFEKDVVPTVVKFTKETLEKQGRGKFSETVLLQHFQTTEEYKYLFYNTHAEYLTVTNFELFHKKVFYISDDLVKQLALTKLDVDAELIIPPFDCCLFLFTSRIAIRALYNMTNERNTHIDFTPPLSVFIMNRPAEEGKRKIVFACWHANHKVTNLFIKRELLIREGWNIEDMLKTDWKDIYQDVDETNGEIDEHIFYREGLLFFRILVNTILYLGSNEPDIVEQLSPRTELFKQLEGLKSKAKRKRVQQKILSTSELDGSIVGRHIGQILVKKPSNSVESTNQISKKKLSKRFIVRGHWRRQPCGTEGQQRKLIWIKPYYKGPDMAELINKSYKVK